MRRFIKRVLVFFICPAFLFFLSCELILRSIPNDYAYKYKWLENNASSLNVLILGSSHTYNGLDPTVFHSKCFNAAYPCQTLKYDDFILSKYIDRMDSLRWVILPIDYHSLLCDLDDEHDYDNWRVKYYHIYYHGFINKEIKYYFEVSDLDRTMMKEMWNRVQSREYTHRYCLTLGHLYNIGISENQNIWMPEVKGELASKRIKTNKGYAINIIDQCRNHGVQVILINSPCLESYINAMDEDYLCSMYAFCDSTSLKYDNVHYLNLLQSADFSSEDFFNPDHLNYEGAQKMTSMVVSYIDKLGD